MLLDSSIMSKHKSAKLESDNETENFPSKIPKFCP